VFNEAKFGSSHVPFNLMIETPGSGGSVRELGTTKLEIVAKYE
jgi:hypothetical protein